VKTTLNFTSDTCHLAEVRSTLRHMLEDSGMDEMEAELLVLAVDEACANIIRHAYANMPGQPVLIEMEKTDASLRITMRDHGKPCDPENLHGRALDDFRPGGLGVHIIRKVFDEVVYQPGKRGTELLLVKQFAPPLS